MTKAWRKMAQRWTPDGELTTWFGAACFAVTVGILSCGNGDGAADPLISGWTQLFAAMVAHALTLVQPHLSGWVCNVVARGIATITTKLLRWRGLF